MAQVSPRIARAAPRAHEWFDTRRQPIGLFRFRGGQQAPTTRGLIHDTPEGRRFILARPAGWLAPPWEMEASFEWQADLAWSARRALLGQTSPRLALLLVGLDMAGRLATLNHVFNQPPTRRDEDAADAVEAEVAADFLDCCDVRTQFFLADGRAAGLPRGMVAYRKRPSAANLS